MGATFKNVITHKSRNKRSHVGETDRQAGRQAHTQRIRHDHRQTNQSIDDQERTHECSQQYLRMGMHLTVQSRPQESLFIRYRNRVSGPPCDVTMYAPPNR